MNTLEQNAEIAVTTARGLRALLDMAEEINDGRKVGAELAEKRAALAAVKEEIDFLKKDAVVAEGQTRKMLIDAKEKVEKAKAEAKKITDKATADAGIIIADAETKADNAMQVKDEYLSQMNAQIADAKNTLEAIQVDIAMAGTEKLRVEAALAEARAKLGV